MNGKIMMLLVAVVLSLVAVPVMAEEEQGTRILFDQGHNQRFLIEEKGELHLSRLAGILRESGAHVSSTRAALHDDVLKGVAALVISGPFESLRSEEVEAVVRFIERGGRVAAMLHIGPPLSGLLARLDVDHSNAVLHERRNIIDGDINFRVSGLSDSPLFAGITEFSTYGSWALDPGTSGVALAHTSPEAWADLDGDKALSRGDVVGAFALAVSGNRGGGSFIVFGDDAIFQNRYLDEHNSRLAGNLAGWLAGR